MDLYRAFLIMLLCCGLGGLVHPQEGEASDIPTTVGLDLDTVYLEVVSPPALKDRLVVQARDLFTQYELPPLAAKPLAHHRLTLKLHLMAEPIGALCPDALLYEPMITLTSEVLVERKSRPIQIQALTWSSEAPAHTIEKGSVRQVIEEDGKEFIEKFIGYNRFSRAAYPEYYANSPTIPLAGENEPSSLSPRVPMEQAILEGLQLDHLEFIFQVWNPIEAFNMDRVKYAAWTEQYKRQFKSYAQSQNPDTGLSLSQSHSGTINKQLLLSLQIWPAQTACPHLRIYEASMRLSEPVQIKRNGLSFTTDTWIRRKVSVVKEVDSKQLSAEADSLMAEFFTDYTAANYPR
ncbi:MAG: hypothetical protein NPIRA06_33620 [Nitrospirales bacterium]|nr:MAG: hypothetical protein NPIRA06_33620 [Nitrospirales bacterium]